MHHNTYCLTRAIAREIDMALASGSSWSIGEVACCHASFSLIDMDGLSLSYHIYDFVRLLIILL